MSSNTISAAAHTIEVERHRAFRLGLASRLARARKDQRELELCRAVTRRTALRNGDQPKGDHHAFDTSPEGQAATPEAIYTENTHTVGKGFRDGEAERSDGCLLYTSPSPRD